MAGFGIFTCMELPLRDIKYVIGPCSFSHFKYGSRNIYLFGERHQPLERSQAIIDRNPHMTKFNTIMFSGLVHSLAAQNPKRKYDLMFESSYFLEKNGSKTVNTQSTSPTFNSITHTFSNCISEDLRMTRCPYRNLRTHYIDFRKSIFNRHIMRLQPITRPDEFIFEVRKLLTQGKVSKQIASIKDATARYALMRFVDFYTTGGGWRKFWDYTTHKDIVMDLYGIARLLREFDPTVDKNNSQFKGTAENVIYYAGGAHIVMMEYFFKNYMNLTPSSIDIPFNVGGTCESFVKLDIGNKALNFV